MEIPNELIPAHLLPRADQIVDAPEDRLEEVWAVVEALQRLCEAHGGLGLHAVQIGVPWRIHVVREDGPDGVEFMNYLNASYTPVGGIPVASMEGCLSLPGRHFRAVRHRKVKFEAVCIEKVASGIVSGKVWDVLDADSDFDAIVQQHEIDHGNGVLISDVGEEVFGC